MPACKVMPFGHSMKGSVWGCGSPQHLGACAAYQIGRSTLAAQRAQQRNRLTACNSHRGHTTPLALNVCTGLKAGMLQAVSGAARALARPSAPYCSAAAMAAAMRASVSSARGWTVRQRCAAAACRATAAAATGRGTGTTVKQLKSQAACKLAG